MLAVAPRGGHAAYFKLHAKLEVIRLGSGQACGSSLVQGPVFIAIVGESSARIRPFAVLALHSPNSVV